jgi:hypothetical protein
VHAVALHLVATELRRLRCCACLPQAGLLSACACHASAQISWSWLSDGLSGLSVCQAVRVPLQDRVGLALLQPEAVPWTAGLPCWRQRQSARPARPLASPAASLLHVLFLSVMEFPSARAGSPAQLRVCPCPLPVCPGPCVLEISECDDSVEFIFYYYQRLGLKLFDSVTFCCPVYISSSKVVFE